MPQAEPCEVVIASYEPGEVVTARVRLRNVSNILQTVHLLPPASQYFHMSLPR